MYLLYIAYFYIYRFMSVKIYFMWNYYLSLNVSIQYWENKNICYLMINMSTINYIM